MMNCRDGISSKKLALLIAMGGLAACSGEPVEQSSEAFSAMADVHNNPDVIASTAEIDQLLIDQDPTGNWMASVFDRKPSCLSEAVPTRPLLSKTIPNTSRTNGVLRRLTRPHRVLLRWLRHGDTGYAL